jgi:hypothetical protein
VSRIRQHMRIAIFPPGLSIGNTLQCSLSFLENSENMVCWLITTKETHSVSKKIAENEERIRVIPRENLNKALDDVNESLEFHYLIGPGTREIQLYCISTLFNNSRTPTIWFIEENISKNKNKNNRCIKSYSDSVIDLVPINEEKVHSILPIEDIEFIKSKGVGWDSKSNRFTYNVTFPPNASLFDKKEVRKFQDQVIQDLQDSKNRFGVHGVIGSHEPIPNTWPVQSLDRFQRDGFRGGRGQ